MNDKTPTVIGLTAEHIQDPDDKVLILDLDVMEDEDTEELECVVEYEIVRGDQTETLQSPASQFFALYRVLHPDDEDAETIDEFVKVALEDIGIIDDDEFEEATKDGKLLN